MTAGGEHPGVTATLKAFKWLRLATNHVQFGLEQKSEAGHAMVDVAAPHIQACRLPRRMGWAGACAAGALLTLFASLGVLDLRVLHQHSAAAQLATRTFQAVEALWRMEADVVSVESGARGYLLTLDAQYLDSDGVSADSVRRDLDALTLLLRNDPALDAQAIALAQAVRTKLQRLDEELRTAREAGQGAGVAALRADAAGPPADQGAPDLRARLDAMRAGARALANERPLRDATASGYGVWLEAAAVVLALLCAAMAAVLVTHELRQSQDVARHLDGLREIAERHAAELEISHHALRVAKEAAERADRAKGRALVETVHDLRQPLLVVALASELLARRAGNAGAQDASRAEAAIAKLDHSLLQLIQVARQSSDTATPLLRSVDLGKLLWNVCDEVWPLAAAKGLQLRLVMTTAHTLTDAEMLSTILRNLIGNAIKYTEHGGIVVGVRRRARGLAIQVYDSGVGIPGTKLAAVFDDFHQLTPDASDGVGLGLSIVRRTAAVLGYQVWVASTPGTGSCFTVELSATAG
jgi:signal transduction histidine kinase